MTSFHPKGVTPPLEVYEGGNFVAIVTPEYHEWHKTNCYIGGPHTICKMTRSSFGDPPTHAQALERARYLVHAANEYPATINLVSDVLSWLQRGAPITEQPALEERMTAMLAQAREIEGE